MAARMHSMHLSVRLILAFLTAGSMSLPVFALSDAEVDGLVTIYRHGRYAAAEALGQVLLEKDPHNLRVHYYLGNTYIKLGRPEEAERHYVFCVEKGAGTKIAELSQTSLSRIEENRSPTTLPSSTRKLLMQALGASDTRSMYGRIKEQSAAARLKLDRDTDEAKHRLYERFGIRPGTALAAVDSANFNDFQKEMAYIDDNYKRKLADISNREYNLLSQTNTGHQRTRLMPLGSGMYVQNYINYGDENDVVEIPAEGPLKAKAGSLAVDRAGANAKAKVTIKNKSSLNRNKLVPSPAAPEAEKKNSNSGKPNGFNK